MIVRFADKAKGLFATWWRSARALGLMGGARMVGYSTMARRRHRTTVRLTGIRLREQGTHDSFCAYYSAAMLLCTLRPEFDDAFDAVHVSGDPLFSNLPRPRRRSLERTVADWLTTGVQFGPLAASLNAACKGTTRFRAKRASCGAQTLELLRAKVDEGLPSVCGWESRELGNHTVLIVGYDRYVQSSSRWLRILDPTRGQEVLEWGQLARVVTAPLDLIWCTAHDGVRPDRLTVERDREGALLGSRVERWTPATEEWQPLVARGAPSASG